MNKKTDYIFNSVALFMTELKSQPIRSEIMNLNWQVDHKSRGELLLGLESAAKLMQTCIKSFEQNWCAMDLQWTLSCYTDQLLQIQLNFNEVESTQNRVEITDHEHLELLDGITLKHLRFQEVMLIWSWMSWGCWAGIAAPELLTWAAYLNWIGAARLLI